jgi:ABC-type transporter Mla subunit MlaD
MLDDDRLDAIDDAIAEIDSGMADVATILGTNVSLIRNDVLQELEDYETKYFALRKRLDKLDAHFKEAALHEKGLQPPREILRLCRAYRSDALRILRGEA